ncbi:MAG: AraC family transcriptional regulator ligand-binding domain-containing protein [Polyangiales bacterium]
MPSANPSPFLETPPRLRGRGAPPLPPPPGAGLLERALDATVAAQAARGLARALLQAGGLEDGLLAEAGLPLESTRGGDQRIARDALDRLCELALERTRVPLLALRCAALARQTAYLPIFHLLLQSASVRQALETLVRYQRLLSDAPTLTLEKHGDAIAVCHLERSGQSRRLRRFDAELTLASLLHLVRELVPRATPVEVAFAHPAPAHHADYAQALGGRVRFGQPTPRIVFDQPVLDAPSVLEHDDEIYAALLAIAEARLTRLTQRTPYAQRALEVMLRRDQWRERVDMPTVAEALGISARSLRRRLVREGSSFAAVSNHALAIAASQLLREQRSIREVAYAMGFSDTSSFHRAFKQWTGTTPRTHRGVPDEHEADA